MPAMLTYVVSTLDRSARTPPPPPHPAVSPTNPVTVVLDLQELEPSLLGGYRDGRRPW